MFNARLGRNTRKIEVVLEDGRCAEVVFVPADLGPETKHHILSPCACCVIVADPSSCRDIA